MIFFLSSISFLLIWYTWGKKYVFVNAWKDKTSMYQIKYFTSIDAFPTLELGPQRSCADVGRINQEVEEL